MTAETTRKITGTIQSGRGEAGQFLDIDWVREQCQKICGFTSYPGTLNLKIGREDADFLRQTACARGVRVIPPPGDDAFCEARILFLQVGEQPAALIFPMVNDYYEDIAEIIAPVGLKAHLGKEDGDTLTFKLMVPEKIPRPKGIIFDLDGTLIDSVELYYSILCDGVRHFNLDIPAREWIMEIMGAGIGFWETWESLASRAVAENKKDEFLSRSRAVFDEIWARRYDREVRLFPGVAELLSRIHKAGIKMGVVTSSFYANKMNLFGENGLDHNELFQGIITSRDSARKKPHPEPVLLCLEQMGVERESCLCVGDSPCDIIAGRECKMLTVGVLTGTGTRQNLSKEGADMILDDVTRMADFIHLEGFI